MRTMFHTFIGFLFLGLASVGHAEQTTDTQASMQKMVAAQMKMMQTLMKEQPSHLGFDATVDTLVKTAKSRGWTVGGVMDMQEAMKKAGNESAKPMKIIGMCPKSLVEEVLHAEQAAQMPPGGISCRYSVYEGKDGKIYVMHFNTEMAAKAAKGQVATALDNFVKEENAVLSGVLN
jgi:uncharacterized protein (DUF302 family)